jgi:hypothetical protein
VTDRRKDRTGWKPPAQADVLLDRLGAITPPTGRWTSAGESRQLTSPQVADLGAKLRAVPWQRRDQPTHKISKQRCVGDVVVGAGLSVGVSAAGPSVDEGGGVVVCGAAGVAAGIPLLVTGAVCGCGLVVAVGWAAAVVVCRRLFVAAVATATVAFRGGLVIMDGWALVPGSCETRVPGCAYGESDSVASVRVVAEVVGSGTEAACAWPVEGRDGSAARVSPPPTSATADATAARRRLFFRSAIWRRRAARPGVVGASCSEPLNGPAADVSAVGSSGAAGPVGAVSGRGVP